MLAAGRCDEAFYTRDAVTVARALIGCALVHGPRAGVIVETEAYLGPEDLASHARFGVTARNSVMYGRGGFAYVYLCYGIHEMFNIVTGPEGAGQAVLVRAVAPLVGFGAPPADDAVGRGPGKVTRALAIDRRHDRRDLLAGDLFVAAHADAPRIAVGPRVGVDYAGRWARRRLRFWWHGHAAVSRTR
ncbi:MAG: DNA-3-methyladenine glycosylase [Deltaproteobacteria bacterium]|nr:DNA-3-methyladenine glycosylase [Deltaproteobacteria bacterium]